MAFTLRHTKHGRMHSNPPARQLPEQSSVVRPVAAPYWPGGHSVHAVAPPTLYVPTGQMFAMGDREFREQ